MKRLIGLALFLAAVQLIAQHTLRIHVKSTEINNGVVIISAEKQAVDASAARTAIELRCNKGLAECGVPQPGDYVLVQLPRNHGMYDCMNADIYPTSADPSVSKKIGEYCLTER